MSTDPTAQQAIRDHLDGGHAATDRIRRINAELRAALAPEGCSHRGPGSENSAPTVLTEETITAAERAFAEHQRGFIAGHEQAQDDLEALVRERDEARAEVALLKSPERDTTGLTYGDKAAWDDLCTRWRAAEAAVTAALALAEEWEAIANRWGEHMPRTAINRVHARRLRAALAAFTDSRPGRG